MIKITTSFDTRRINKALAAVPASSREVVFRRALPAACKVAMRAAQERAPRGRSTGTTNEQSAKSRKIWGAKPLANWIRWKVSRPNNKVAVGLVGPERPEGNKINFIAPFKKAEKRVKLWGKDPVNIPATRTKDDRFMERAMEESKGEQQRVFTRMLITQVRKEIKRMIGV